MKVEATHKEKIINKHVLDKTKDLCSLYRKTT